MGIITKKAMMGQSTALGRTALRNGRIMAMVQNTPVRQETVAASGMLGRSMGRKSITTTV